MSPEALSDELSRQPFQPLRLHLSDGRTVDVTDPANVLINGLSVYIYKLRRDHGRMADDNRLYSLNHVVSVEPIAAKKPK